MKAPILLALALAAPAMVSTAQAETPGFVETSLGAAEIPAVIWYPALPGGTPDMFATNPVFTGVAGVEEADLAPGKYPLILASHGLGGHYRSMSWLSAGLAKAGAIVVAVNHPGSSVGDFSMPRGMDHWTRVADLETAINAVLADPDFGPWIDRDRIMLTGFSYGGWTALSAAGLQGNLQGYADHCARDETTHCADLARFGVDFTLLDPGTWNASYRLPQVSRVAAIDAGLTWGIEDVSGLAVPAMLIGLGQGADRLVATDTSDNGSGLASRLQATGKDVTLVDIVPAAHFTALLPCTEQGAAILLDEGDDPVCTDPAGVDRVAVHARIVAEVAAFFGL